MLLIIIFYQKSTIRSYYYLKNNLGTHFVKRTYKIVTFYIETHFLKISSTTGFIKYFVRYFKKFISSPQLAI